MSDIVDRETIEEAGRSLRDAVGTLSACISKIVKAIAEDERYDRELVVHLTWLTHEMVRVVAELRMLDAGPPAGKVGGKASSLVDRFKPRT